MKNQFLLGLIIVLFAACDQKEGRYTQQSPEIDTYKKVIANYENRNWEALALSYSDTARIMNNVAETAGLTTEEMIQVNKEDASIFNSWDFVDEDSTYEMVKTDEGETWVNFWGLWQGRLNANNKIYEIPVHITARFVDGKIVREHGYWDVSQLLMDIQALSGNEPLPTEQKSM